MIEVAPGGSGRAADVVGRLVAPHLEHEHAAAAHLQLVDEGAAKATAANRAWLKTRDKELADLEKAGIKVTKLTPAARAEFQKRSEPLYVSGVLSADQVASWKKAAAQ